MSNQSHVQDVIIGRLKNADSLRHSQLKPDSVDKDLFNYHLRELVGKGIVTKLENRGGYKLSHKGQQRVADIIHTSDQSSRLFKVNPLLIAVDKRSDGLHILSQERTAQPDYGIQGVPGGTIIKSELLLDGAARKLREETGLKASFQLIATTRRIDYRQGQLFSDVFFPICVTSEWSGDLIDTEFGRNSWVLIDQAIENDHRIIHLQTVLIAIKNDDLASVTGSYYEQISKA